jgi:uncharacterized protein YcaQ
MQTLEEDVATQYVLKKHHLLNVSKAENVLQVVNDIIALHATSAGTPYLSLFARMKNFQRRHLDEEFYVKRNLIRLTAMRSTLFITSIESAPLLYQATKWSEPQLLKWLRKWGIQPSEHQELTQKLHNILKGGGKTLSEIKKVLPKEIMRSVEVKAGKSIYRGTNVSTVLNAMTLRGLVISEKALGTLRLTSANHYRLIQENYPNLNLESIESEEAKAMLVKCYVKVFGPVTEDDIAWWTGLSKTDMKMALTAIEKELVNVLLNGLRGDYLMLKTDYEQLLEFKPSKTHSVSLLPYEDPYTKGYKARERLIEKEREKTVYVGGGVQPTILLNGKIIGTWNRSIEEGIKPIKLDFFSQPKKDIELEMVQNAKAIGRLMTNREIDVKIGLI